MSRRTYRWNGYQSSLTGAISNTATEIALTSVVGLRAPGRLVIDPDVIDTREWIHFTGISTNTLTGVTRGIAGNSGAGGAIAHGAGAVIRSAAMHQELDDVFSDLEDIETDITQHPEAANPHTQYELTSTHAADRAAHNADANPHPGYVLDGTYTDGIATLRSEQPILGADATSTPVAVGSGTPNAVASVTLDMPWETWAMQGHWSFVVASAAASFSSSIFLDGVNAGNQWASIATTATAADQSTMAGTFQLLGTGTGNKTVDVRCLRTAGAAGTEAYRRLLTVTGYPR